MHDGVLDSIVNHFHKVAGCSGADVRHTRFTLYFRRYGFKNMLHNFVCLLVTARHHAWAFPSSLFSTGDSHSEEVQAFLLQFIYASIRIGKMRVTAINDDIAFIQQW